MSSDIFFLQPVIDPSSPDPNFAIIEGSTQFFGFTQDATDVVASTDAALVVRGDEAIETINSDAIALNDPAFVSLTLDKFATGNNGAFEVVSQLELEAATTFDIAAGQPFSFTFSIDFLLETKEIEAPRLETNRAELETGFLVLDISDPQAPPTVLNAFGIRARLASSEKDSRTDFSTSFPTSPDNSEIVPIEFVTQKGSRIDFSTSPEVSETFSIESLSLETDVDGNNGTDVVSGFILGTYQQFFGDSSRILVAEVANSAFDISGDTFIGTLGEEVLYGSVLADLLAGTAADDEVYSSLGNDTVSGAGGDDILEGGSGDDLLRGNKGSDRLNGGDGDDTLKGGRGNDILRGGEGADRFVFRRSKSQELDTVKDFEIGIDKILLANVAASPGSQQFDRVVRIEDSAEGTRIQVRERLSILLEGVSADRISSADFL